MPDTTLFEHPLTEKCRTWLRLSHLFEQLDFHAPFAEEWHSRAAIAALLDVAAVLSRADIKSELLKELDRYQLSLGRMADSPGVDAGRLQKILDELQRAMQGVRGVSGQLGQALRSDDFLNGIVQRSSIAGGDFDFDLPQYHYWLQMPYEARARQLDEWRDQVAVVQFAVDLLLNLIRSSAVPQEARAENGFYQQSLPGNAVAQLVRVRLPAAGGMYAEISGGKHRFTVRIMDCSDWQHPAQVDGDVPFSLTTCMMKT